MSTLQAYDTTTMTTADDAHELMEIGREEVRRTAPNILADASDGQHRHEDGLGVQELAPIDGGRQAWTYCVSAFVLETLVWGFGYRYISQCLHLAS